MKVTIENLPPGEEAEIIIRANTLSQRVMNLLQDRKSTRLNSSHT